MGGQKTAFILETQAGELPVGRAAKDDVAGVVGVLEEGRVGIFAAEAGCVYDLRVRCRDEAEKDCKTCNCCWLHSFPGGAVKYADSTVQGGACP
jgi:hypothetical protein